jgi:predicted ferric reductase
MRRNLQRWIWPALAVLSPALPLHAYLAGSWGYVFHIYSLAMVFGIVAYVYFANALVLAARIPYFDRLYGHDRVMVFHGHLAVAGIACVLVHAGLKVAYDGARGTQVAFGIAAAALLVLVALFTLLFMVGGPLQRIPAFARLRSAGVRRPALDYRRLKAFHNLTGVAMILAMIHVLMALPTAETNLRLAIMAGWGGIGILAWIYHKAVRVLLCLRNAYAVTRVESLGDGITRLTATPRHGQAGKRFLPGQFGYFRILSKSCGTEEHPFTIASPPNERQLSIVAKALGDYSAALAQVAPGARLLFDGPYGRFTPELNAAPYLFIAGGIGITPFLSIVADWARREITQPVSLVWSVRYCRDLVDGGLFEGLARGQDLFTYTPVITREDGGTARRMDRELLAPIVRRRTPERLQVYVCGPAALLKAVLGSMQDIGVSRRQVHYESFGS